MRLLSIILDPISDFFNLTWFDEDLYTLLLRLSINLIVITIIIRYLYYPITKRKDYLFTYYLIGLTTFFLLFSLKKLDIDTGMGLGLFAIFGIIRYRTDAIEIKEMTYLFLVIGVSVVNSLASNKISIIEMAVINITVVVVTYIIEYKWLVKHLTRKTIVYERIDLITPDKYREMKDDIELRTGLTLHHFDIGKINFLDDTANVRIFYYAEDQTMSDYHNE